MVNFTKTTPLFTSIGETSPVSFATVTENLSKSSLLHESEFEEKVIDYTIEWEKIVSVKFKSELKEASESRKVLEKYQKKVGHLRSNKQKLLAKGKDPSKAAEEKLVRNEGKLEDAEHNFEKHQTNLGRLSEQFIEKSWKDLYPLLVQLMELDLGSSKERQVITLDLQDVLKDLTDTAEKNEIGVVGGTATELWRTIPGGLREGSTTPTKPKASLFPDVELTPRKKKTVAPEIERNFTDGDETALTESSDHIEPKTEVSDQSESNTKEPKDEGGEKDDKVSVTEVSEQDPETKAPTTPTE